VAFSTILNVSVPTVESIVQLDVGPENVKLGSPKVEPIDIGPEVPTTPNKPITP